MSATDREYLSFILNGEEFAIDILCVQEIRVWSPVTALPNTPDYLKGVINLRGTIVPIIDLQQRFGRPPLHYGATTVTIILRAEQQGKQVVAGLVVEAVSEVYKFSDQDVRPTPDLGSQIDSSFLHGMATVEDKLVVLLDTARLLDVDALYQLSHSIRAAS